jgi:hypothetical protein
MVRMRGEGESHITYSLDKIRLACFSEEEKRKNLSFSIGRTKKNKQHRDHENS